MKNNLDITAVKEYCLSFVAVSSTRYAAPSNVLAYHVDDKQFAYFKTSEPEQWRFSIRTSPERLLELTDMPGIKPARYMGRFHWVTIVDVRTMSADYLEELITWSYTKALHSLTKRRQSLILEQGKPVVLSS